MRASSVAAAKFPFPDTAFASARLRTAQLRLHEQQIHQLIAQALAECDRADTLGRAAYPAPWEVVGAHQNVTALRRREPHATTKSHYRLIGDVSGEYRDLMDLHYAETSHELYEWMQFMYHHTLDAHVLQTVQTATAENPHHYFGVKWAVFQLSAFATKIDQCFVEYMTYRKDLRGRDVGIRVTLPIRLPEIDLTMDALKVRRLSSQMVQIWRPVYDTTSPCTRMFVMIENDCALSAPAVYTKSLLTMSQNLAMCVDSRRIRRRGLVAETKWVPNGARKSCVVCTRTFGATRGRHHCRLCGEVVCRKCMLVRDTADPVTRKTFKVAKTKFCVVCVANLRRPEDAVDLSASAVLRSSKTRGMEFAPREFDETSRVSVWSETESEGCGHADFDPADSVRSSLSEQDGEKGEKASLGKRLEEIAERMEDAVIEDGPSTDSAHRSKPELVLFVPDETTDTAEFMVTIDTKDMIRGAPVDLDAPSPLSSSGVFEQDGSRRKGSSPLSAPRSLDQCLAEQEALLRQMVMAAQGRAARADAPPPHGSEPV